jgi:hypothetical protein
MSAVVGLPLLRLFKAVVGTEVDDSNVRGKAGRDRCRLSVRQGQKDEV